MTELQYHNGHYHAVRVDPNRKRRFSVWRKAYEMWDQVLYGVGSAYEKLCGHV